LRALPCLSPACGHELCVKCALDLCSVMKSYDVPGIAGSIPCPLCRSAIASFRRRVASEEEEPLNPASTCSTSSSDGHQSSPEKEQGSDQAILPVYCAPFIPPPAVLT
jgi:E3 ubiquitin-protein ligase XBAT32/33